MINRIKDTQFAYVIRAYENSPKFAELAPGTRENYSRLLRLIEREDTLGALSVYVLRPSLVQGFLDALSDRPGAQFNARAVLCAVQKWARVRDLLPHDIMTGTTAPGTGGGHDPWPDAMVELGERKARPDLSRIITLMVHTGQRGSDVVRMRLNDIEEHRDPVTGRMVPGINVIQKKTDIKLWVPMTDELIAFVDGWRKDILPPWLIVRQPNGEPYTRPQLSCAWNDQRKRDPALEPIREAGLALHGLRGTCVVRLRKRGASVLQICSMIGMSEPMVSRYSRFADKTDMALAAVHFLNTGKKGEQTKKKGIK